jgi:hypothetical protein
MWPWSQASPYAHLFGGKSLGVQDNAAMNVWVLSDPLAWFHHNEQKAITMARRHVILEWDKLQGDLEYTPKVPKPSLIKLTFSHIF